MCSSIIAVQHQHIYISRTPSVGQPCAKLTTSTVHRAFTGPLLSSCPGKHRANQDWWSCGFSLSRSWRGPHRHTKVPTIPVRQQLQRTLRAAATKPCEGSSPRSRLLTRRCHNPSDNPAGFGEKRLNETDMNTLLPKSSQATLSKSLPKRNTAPHSLPTYISRDTPSPRHPAMLAPQMPAKVVPPRKRLLAVRTSFALDVFLAQIALLQRQRLMV